MLRTLFITFQTLKHDLVKNIFSKFDFSVLESQIDRSNDKNFDI